MQARPVWDWHICRSVGVVEKGVNVPICQPHGVFWIYYHVGKSWEPAKRSDANAGEPSGDRSAPRLPREVERDLKKGIASGSPRRCPKPESDFRRKVLGGRVEATVVLKLQSPRPAPLHGLCRPYDASLGAMASFLHHFLPVAVQLLAVVRK